MTLRDASAYNIQFRGPKPVLIDSLSFERYEPGKPVGRLPPVLRALPRAARADGHPRCPCRPDAAGLIDGIPLDLASSLLPGRTRARFGLLTHLHLHARAQREHAGDDGARSKTVTISTARLVALIGNLRKTVARGCAGSPAARSGPTTRTTPPTRTPRRPPRRASWSRCSRRGRRRGVGPGRQHRPLLRDRRGPGPARRRLGHRPGRGGASPPGAQEERRDAHHAAGHRPRGPQPGAGWALAERARWSIAATRTCCWASRWCTTWPSAGTCRCP